MEKSNLSNEIFETLKNRIIRWEYPPGQRLTEESLCHEFGVSRIPVREALRMLEDNQLVDKVPYRGCTVKQPDLDEINQLYDVRLALELFVVEYLATRGMPEETWQQLHQSWSLPLEQNPASALDALGAARQDVSFHETLAQATGNRTLVELLHSVNERLFFVRMSDITTAERLGITCRQHLQILDHIRAKEIDAARAAMKTNIEYGRANVESALKDALMRAYLTPRETEVP